MSNFSDIEIELDSTQQKEMIEIYVRNKLRPESQSMFNDMLKAGNDDLVLCNALYHAILNDVCSDCIEIAIDMEGIVDDD